MLFMYVHVIQVSTRVGVKYMSRALVIEIQLKLPQNITIIIQAILALYIHSLIHSQSSYISLEKNCSGNTTSPGKKKTWVTHAAKILRNPLTASHKTTYPEHKPGQTAKASKTQQHSCITYESVDQRATIVQTTTSSREFYFYGKAFLTWRYLPTRNWNRVFHEIKQYLCEAAGEDTALL